tara:strand:- start:141 stop:677 length:537 start_codon:yes stop_codon:yes gene_type:complete
VTNKFKEIKILTPEIFSDKRGAFFESYNKKLQQEINVEFVQENHSVSHKNVIRGLHYQWDYPMGKLVRIVRGSVMDYFVDIRKDSPTYGQYDSILLSDKNHTMVWIPPYFAHGFRALEDNTVMLYKCSAFYNKEGESAINPFDQDIGIDWSISSNEVVCSDKDWNAQSFKNYSQNSKF